MIFNSSGNCKGNVDELIAALHPKLSSQNDRPALLQSIPIKDLQSIGAANQLHERSRFVQESGQWFCADGDILPPLKLI